MIASFSRLAARGDVDDRAQPEPLRRPGRRRPVVSSRGGHDGGGSAGSVGLEGGEGPAPLERAELMHVLAL